MVLHGRASHKPPGLSGWTGQPSTRKELLHGLSRNAVQRTFRSGAHVDGCQLSRSDQASHLLCAHAQSLSGLLWCQEAPFDQR
jgi:hypothetical protein